MYLESPSCGTSERGEGGDRMTALSEEELALLESIPTSPEVAVRRMYVRMGNHIGTWVTTWKT